MPSASFILLALAALAAGAFARPASMVVDNHGNTDAMTLNFPQKGLNDCNVPDFPDFCTISGDCLSITCKFTVADVPVYIFGGLSVCNFSDPMMGLRITVNGQNVISEIIRQGTTLPIPGLSVKVFGVTAGVDFHLNQFAWTSPTNFEVQMDLDACAFVPTIGKKCVDVIPIPAFGIPLSKSDCAVQADPTATYLTPVEEDVDANLEN